MSARARLAPAGSAVVYSTYLGGDDADFGAGIAVNADGAATFASGFTSSPDFPVTPGALQTVFAGHRDGFVAKITETTRSGVGHVNGGGGIRLGDNAATFSLNVQRKSAAAPITGHVQYVNHDTQERLRSVSLSAPSIAGNTATIEGTCTIGRTACTFSAVVIDHGEPGREDSFTIAVAAGPPQGGVLRNGNIRVQGP
jgi:hypothetical protein